MSRRRKKLGLVFPPRVKADACRWSRQTGGPFKGGRAGIGRSDLPI